ncbi:hypothetical protein PSH79_15940 [Pseudomonas sp. FP2196]|nr:hypothetical protein [Pseudomonas sp. FP2196]WLH33424.1 hypothetical protein PSH79_15940 [Pseudomonas sp. FP2196]
MRAVELVGITARHQYRGDSIRAHTHAVIGEAIGADSVSAISHTAAHPAG